MNGTPPAGLRLAVIGDPVAHSASPALMRGFLADAGIEGSYEAIRIPAGSGAAAIESLRARGFHGLNVTTPLKEEAFARAEERDASALASRSVNTLVLGARIAGHNTDGAGALGALREAGLSELGGRSILVLGAGPTARSACVAFVASGAEVYVWNRTAARAAELARDVSVHPFEAGLAAAAVFSALPPRVHLGDDALRAAVLAAPLLVDANYGERATLATSLGRSATDGLAMLRHSAAASFALWRQEYARHSILTKATPQTDAWLRPGRPPSSD